MYIVYLRWSSSLFESPVGGWHSVGMKIRKKKNIYYYKKKKRVAGAKGVVARGRGCVLMCARYAATTTAAGRPRPTSADRERGALEPTDRPAGRLSPAVASRTRARGAVAWASASSSSERAPLGALCRQPAAAARTPARASARAGIAPRALRSSETVPRPDANARRSVDRHSYDCCNQQLTFSHRVLSSHCHH